MEQLTKQAPRMTPGQIDLEEFQVILRDITGGKTITVEELEDVVAYANAVPEMIALIRALSNGYKVLLGRINYKNKMIGSLKRQLEAADRRLQRRGTVDPSPTEGGGTHENA